MLKNILFINRIIYVNGVHELLLSSQDVDDQYFKNKLHVIFLLSWKNASIKRLLIRLLN